MNNAATILWARMRPDDAGLVPAIVQDVSTHRVLMLGYMNQAALAATLSTGLVTFWSRSRDSLWTKGETSGHTLHLESVRLDCDLDAILVLAHPRGPTCHTGTTSCFFQELDFPDAPATLTKDDGPHLAASAWFEQVFRTILDRKAGLGATNADGKSYVRSLLEKGPAKIGEKVNEEAGELAEALLNETDERVVNEAADLLFHAFVGLAQRDLTLADVARVFASRFGRSGIDEKASR